MSRPYAHRLFLAGRLELAVLIAFAGLLAAAFAPTLAEMARIWWNRAEYGHGLLMPPVALWMIWERRRELARLEARTGSASGLFSVVAALALVPLCLSLVLGEMKYTWFLKPFSFVGCLAALVGVLYGWKGIRALRTPLVALALMCPLPFRVMEWATLPLKRYATVIATGLIDVSGLQVGLHGNMIHIPGIESLWVADACSGLRSAVSLVSIAILGCLLWKRHWSLKLLVIASCVPIAVLVNGARIWLTAMLSYHVSPEAASGFFHLFEGLLLFGVAALIVLGWALILHFAVPRRSTDAAAPPAPEVHPASGASRSGALLRGASIGLALLFLAGGAYGAARVRSRLGGEGEDRVAAARLTETFRALPLSIPEGGYRGQPIEWDDEVVAKSGADVYRSAMYADGEGRTYQLFLGGALRNDDNFHTPNVCMPASGWEVLRQTQVPFSVYALEGRTPNAPDEASGLRGAILRVVRGLAGTLGLWETEPRMQRLILQRGSRQMLVYFWFQAGPRLASREGTVRTYRLLDLVADRPLAPTLIVSVYVPILGGLDATDKAALRFLEALGPHLREATASGGIHG